MTYLKKRIDRKYITTTNIRLNWYVGALSLIVVPTKKHVTISISFNLFKPHFIRITKMNKFKTLKSARFETKCSNHIQLVEMFNNANQ